MSAASRRLMRIALAAAALTSLEVAKAQPYSSPVVCDGCISDWYYVDHGNNTDYNCDSATYSDHDGTDFSLRRGNAAINDGNEVVAARAGVVTVASDGNYDQCSACGGSGCGTNTPGGGFANYVVIDHGEQDTTYGHMRNGSIMVQVGDSVECGQVIGHIGSSGCSTGAHLHFQPRLEGGRYDQDPLDPFEGPCSPTSPSLWQEQGPHEGLPSHTCEVDPPPPCPDDSFEVWTCTEDSGSRRRCIDGVDSTEACPWGCTPLAEGTDDVCALPPDDDEDGSRADTDCDDTHSGVYPGAVEICGDAIDQDCSGGDDECPSAAAATESTVDTTGTTTTTGSAAASNQAAGVTNDTAVASGAQSSTGPASGTAGTPTGPGAVTTSSAAAPGASGGGAAASTAQSAGDSASAEDQARVEAGCSCRLGGVTSHGNGASLLVLLAAASMLTRRARPSLG